MCIVVWYSSPSWCNAATIYPSPAYSKSWNLSLVDINFILFPLLRKFLSFIFWEIMATSKTICYGGGHSIFLASTNSTDLMRYLLYNQAVILMSAQLTKHSCLGLLPLPQPFSLQPQLLPAVYHHCSTQWSHDRSSGSFKSIRNFLFPTKLKSIR